MTNLIEIREYFETDKNEALSLLRENTPRYCAREEELEFIEYLENRRDPSYFPNIQ